jgi:diguanylate cyclase (GGDEF)-like protein
MKWLRLLATLLALLSITETAVAAHSTIGEGRLLLRASNALQAEPIALTGTWHFFPNRWITPEELSSVNADAGWAQVPGAWPSAIYGINTYWLEVVVDHPIAPSTLHFHYVCGAANMYFYRAGSEDVAPVLVAGQPGRNALSEKISGDNLVANIPALQPGLYHLLINQSNFHLRASGLCGAVTWGLEPIQAHARALDTVKNTLIATMLLSLALGSLMLGSQNGERAAPWLAMICMACATLVAIKSGLLSVLLPPESNWLGQLNYFGIFSALIWLPPALLMLFRHTFNIALPRWLVLINLLIPVAFTLALMFWLTFFTQYPQLITITWGIQTCIAFAVLIAACRRGRQYALLALLASVPLLGATFYDNYRFFTEGVIEILTPYAIAFLAAVHGGIYTLKFGASYQLTARLSAHLQEEVDLRTRELREKNYNLEQTQNALQRANETLRELSITDGLTRVHNRMYFEQQFEKEWRRCARHALPLSILMIDADHFKQLNDRAGHLVGDLCLQSIAQEIQNNFKRSGDVVARYGGEEFIVLLPDTNQNKALAVAETLRLNIERLSFVDDAGTAYRVTISIGVSTTVPGLDQRPAQLLATADAALYEAKDSGRNRVHSIPTITSRAAMAQQKLHL